MKKERIDNSTNTRAEKGNFVSDKERIKQLEEQLEKLERIKDRFKRMATDVWADFQEKQKVNLEIAQRVVELNNKPVADIIQNMYFGRTPGDSVEFCEIFGLIKKGYCKEGRMCVDCIDHFLMEYYKERIEQDRQCEQKAMPANEALPVTLLVQSDGYSIDESYFPDVESARKEMTKQYRRAYPYSNEEEADETTAMSSLGKDEAILYDGGENVYLWKVVNLKEV